jgi:hypothetical protein
MTLGRRPQRGTKAPPGEAAAEAEEARTANTAKTLRLRALRLAKEAADRDAEKAASATHALAKQSSRIRVRPRSPA